MVVPAVTGPAEPFLIPNFDFLTETHSVSSATPGFFSPQGKIRIHILFVTAVLFLPLTRG